MFTYPSKDGIFAEFFNKLAILCLSSDLLEIAGVTQWLSDQHRMHDAIAPIFLYRASIPNDKRPSEYQTEIYLCEKEMMNVLNIVLERAQRRICDTPVSDLYHQRIQEVTSVSIADVDNPYPIVHALRYYNRIAVEIMDVPGCVRQPDEATVSEVLSRSLEIFKLIQRFKEKFTTLAYVATDHLSGAEFSNISAGIKVMLIDVEPRNNCEVFALTLSSILQEKLFNLHGFLLRAEEAKLLPAGGRKKKPLPLAPTISQKLRYQIIHVNALLRNTNLAARPGYREIFTKQARTEAREVGANLTTYTWGLDERDPVSFVTDNTQAYFRVIDNLEILLTTINILKSPKKFSMTDLKDTALQQLGHLYYQANLLNLYRTNIRYIDSNQRDFQKKDIELVLKLTMGMAHLVDPSHKEFSEVPAEFENMMDNLTSSFLTYLFFGQMKSDCVSNVIGSLLHLKLKYMLMFMPTIDGRQSIFKSVQEDIFAIMLVLDTKAKQLPRNNLLMTIHFALDYYCLGLMECRELNEAIILTELALLTPILSLLEDYPTNYIYEFTYSYLIWLKTNGMDPGNQGVNHFQQLSGAQSVELFKLVISAIDNLHKPVVRINSIVKRFFYTHAKLLLLHVIATGENADKSVAKSRLTMLEAYLDRQEQRAVETLALFAPDKIPYYPVKFVVKEENKLSFLQGIVLSETRKNKSVNTNSKPKNNPLVAPVVNEERSEHQRVTIRSTTKRLMTELGTVHDVIEFCKKHFGNRYQTVEQGYALVRMAECLVKLENKKEKQCKLALDLTIAAERILPKCKMELSSDVYDGIFKDYSLAMAKYNQSVIKPASDDKSTQALPGKKDSKKQPAKQTKNPVNSGRKTGTQPAPKKPAATTQKVKSSNSAVNHSGVTVPAAPQSNPWKMSVLVDAALVKPEPNDFLITAVKYERQESLKSVPAPVAPEKKNDCPLKSLYSDRVLSIKPNKLQQVVISLLHDNGMVPYCHGGSVVYAAKIPNANIKPEPDFDIGCFPASKGALLKLIVDHKDLLGIADVDRDIRADDKNSVLIITFNTKQANGEAEKLEIAYIPVASKEEIRGKLIDKAAEYGVNSTGYCLAINGQLLYPTDQHRKFIENNLISVGWEVSADSADDLDQRKIIEYFLRFPERQLDVIDRIAKLGHYQCMLMIEPKVVNAIYASASALRMARTTFTRIDRLFMQGYARCSFVHLHQLNILPILFPMLELRHLPRFFKACDLIDSDIMKCTTRPTQVEIIEYRSRFFANALFDCFFNESNMKFYHENSYAMFEQCEPYLRKSPIYISNQYLNYTSIQSIWAEKLVKKLNTPGEDYMTDSLSDAFTGEIFVEPMYCTLDWHTYEKAWILQWLTKHRCAPSNRCALLPNQKPEDVLMPNLTVRDAVAEYREKNKPATLGRK